MKYLLLCLFLSPSLAVGASIKQASTIACISNDSTVKGQYQRYDAQTNPEKAGSLFSEWLFAENFSQIKSKIKFIWKPISDKGPSIKIITNEKAHNLIKIRSQTKRSLLVISSASSPFTTESWSFAFNFAIETMIATRVQSNLGGVKAEIITYDCQYEPLKKDTSTSRRSVS